MNALLILFFAFTSVWAQDWETLMKAQSQEELIKADSGVTRQERLLIQCQVEDSKQWFPKHCFELFSDQLVSLSDSPVGRQKAEDLEQKCLTRYRSLVDLHELRWLIKELPLSKACFEKLKLHQLDLEYSQTSTF